MLQEAKLGLISADESSDTDVTAVEAESFLADDANPTQHTRGAGGDGGSDSDDDCGL